MKVMERSLSSIDLDRSFALGVESRQRALIVFTVIMALIWTIIYFQFTVDDAFISFRYGRMLVEHHIWNWNPSGDRVESYTSASYTLLGIIPALLHLPQALFFKLFGLICIGAMAYRIRTVAPTGFASLLSLVLIGANPWVWVHAYSGLETPLYMLLLLEMAICVKQANETTAPYVYAIFLLLPLTRPEGIVFACVGVALFWHKNGNIRKHLPYFGAAVAIGILYFLARWQYFHHLLPNPFYVKVAHSSPSDIVRNLASNLNQFKGYFLTISLVILIARKLETRVFALITFLLMLLLFAPHPMPMNYADRFYFQISFPIIIFFLLTEDVVHISRISCIIAVVSLVAITGKSLSDPLSYFLFLKQTNIDLGRKIAPFAQDHTLLLGDAGAIPYYSNWVTYDFIGLCTNKIAKNGITLPMMREMNPDLILINSSTLGLDGASYGPQDQMLIVDYINQSGKYQYAGASRWRDHYYLEFLRKDTPQKGEILRALQENALSSAKIHLSIRDLLLQKYVL